MDEELTLEELLQEIAEANMLDWLTDKNLGSILKSLEDQRSMQETLNTPQLSKAELAAHINWAPTTLTTTPRQTLGMIRQAGQKEVRSLTVPSYMSDARTEMYPSLKLCATVGHPWGNANSSSKVAEACRASQGGVDELDVAINIGLLLDKMYLDLFNELREIRMSATKCSMLKVSLQTYLLDDKQKLAACILAYMAGFHCLKTSAGALINHQGERVYTSELDVSLLSQVAGFTNQKVEAVGNMADRIVALYLIAAGADFIGTSDLDQLTKKPANCI